MYHLWEPQKPKFINSSILTELWFTLSCLQGETVPFCVSASKFKTKQLLHFPTCTAVQSSGDRYNNKRNKINKNHRSYIFKKETRGFVGLGNRDSLLQVTLGCVSVWLGVCPLCVCVCVTDVDQGSGGLGATFKSSSRTERLLLQTLLHNT